MDQKGTDNLLVSNIGDLKTSRALRAATYEAILYMFDAGTGVHNAGIP
uniref:Uncharacterized protein n=1 Tax=Melanopsichium pennsylvanicum 4 TaxID=1398559 RepID=A0A077R364_9BASI|nr:uncharacterized protein BN887_06301 [Melanopsichium pennsylvanicum 4]